MNYISFFFDICCLTVFSSSLILISLIGLGILIQKLLRIVDCWAFQLRRGGNAGPVAQGF